MPTRLGGQTNPAATRELRATLAQQPMNIEATVTLARQYITTARQTSDPRYLGYAEAVLAP